MSRFWRQSRIDRGFVWWARCDLCRWSGPTERFSIWTKGEDIADICDHDWCDNPTLNDQLRMDGWKRHPAMTRPEL